MKGIKFDNGDEKMKWMLIPWVALKEIVKVLMEALLRHVIADAEGELVDSDYGLLHLAHAGCCVLFLIWFYIKEGMFKPFTPDYKAIEERYKKQKEEAFAEIK